MSSYQCPQINSEIGGGSGGRSPCWSRRRCFPGWRPVCPRCWPAGTEARPFGLLRAEREKPTARQFLRGSANRNTDFPHKDKGSPVSGCKLGLPSPKNTMQRWTFAAGAAPSFVKVELQWQKIQYCIFFFRVHKWVSFIFISSNKSISSADVIVGKPYSTY